MKKIGLLLLIFVLTSCSFFKYEAGVSRKYAFNMEISDLKTSDAKDNEPGILSFKIVSSLCLLDEGEVISDAELNATTLNIELSNIGSIKPLKNLLDDKAKKDAYSMRPKSTIRKEWYEQIEAVENSIINKKIKELNVTDLENDNIKAKATISLDPYLLSIDHSSNNIVGVKNNIYRAVYANHSSMDIVEKATTKKVGNGIVKSYYGIILFDNNMKVLDIITDKIEQPFMFDHLGKWQKIVAVASKQEQLDYSNYKGLSVEELLAQLDANNEYSQVIKLAADKLNEK